MQRIALFCCGLWLTWVPAALDAAGSGTGSADTTAPPQPTETTTQCEDGLVWDEKTETCVEPESGQLDDDTLYRAVRELAYAGRYRDAQRVLDAMQDRQSDRVATYRGFLARKMGDWEKALYHYHVALERNPDNILVRSYLGQGLVEHGQVEAAEAQLREIRARGGRGTWAEFALADAIRRGEGYAY